MHLTDDPSVPPPPLRPATARAKTSRDRHANTKPRREQLSTDGGGSKSTVHDAEKTAEAVRQERDKEAYDTATRLKKELDGTNL